MKVTRIIVAGLAIVTLGLSANASAQEWRPPPPHWGRYNSGYGDGSYRWRGAGSYLPLIRP